MRCVWKSKSLPGLCLLPFSRSSRCCEFYKILRNANAHQSLSCLYCKTVGMLKFRISSIVFINSIHICLHFFFLLAFRVLFDISPKFKWLCKGWGAICTILLFIERGSAAPDKCWLPLDYKSCPWKDLGQHEIS